MILTKSSIALLNQFGKPLDVNYCTETMKFIEWAGRILYLKLRIII